MTQDVKLGVVRNTLRAPVRYASAVLLAILSLSLVAVADRASADEAPCPNGNAGLTLPKGFCATVFADDLGAPRHLAVAPDGTLYANNRRRGGGPSLLALKDTKGEGRADVMETFGPPGGGGTGIGIYKNWLFVEIGDEIVRYELKPGDVTPKGQPQAVVSKLPIDGDHSSRPFAINAKGDLFVDLGSATNSCQQDNRAKESPGINPCVELETRAGIWRFDANKTGQVFSAAERFATGLRNAEGIDFDVEGRVFATQHGRDQLYENWTKLYSSEQGSELPAEVLVEAREGGDYGWPYCYYDGFQQKLVLAPEYGGDGGKTVGRCADKLPPVAAFPGHWAPNDLKIYNAKQFPETYQGGAFIAFHGSWNRSSGGQQGYNVVFQPLKDGKASGPYIVFADGFRNGDGTSAEHRPTGLAVGPDGALYVADDAAGRIWRIVYKG
ncbi:sorbosone dehydrogenase family protein [Hyphomicrobium sp.]|jgi:glucose/arabinose dehydrogenase|uniref:PQQ-dependent sugar dehydrogenase n=1 Tax=Hyphomicrobium sp. TaxID=82 RepID=UPI0035682E43